MFSVRRLDAADFAAEVIPTLAEREAEHNLMIGLALRIAAEPAATPGAVFCAVERHGRLVGAALRTPPKLPIVTRLPAGAARAVAEFFRGIGDVPDGAIGPDEQGRDLAAVFAEWHAGRVELASDEIIYELNELREPRAPRGRARSATDDDAPVVVRFLGEFIQEVALPHPPDPRELAARLLRHDAVRLWDDGEPRALACWTRQMTRGTAIAPVYTAKDSRGRGYGGAVTAALCRELFANGRSYVCLHADRNNPTSNHLYRKLGFREVATLNVWTVR
jgi:ribosomal protein S18 acetylase RimI-like enzyme